MKRNVPLFVSFQKIKASVLGSLQTMTPPRVLDTCLLHQLLVLLTKHAKHLTPTHWSQITEFVITFMWRCSRRNIFLDIIRATQGGDTMNIDHDNAHSTSMTTVQDVEMTTAGDDGRGDTAYLWKCQWMWHDGGWVHGLLDNDRHWFNNKAGQLTFESKIPTATLFRKDWSLYIQSIFSLADACAHSNIILSIINQCKTYNVTRSVFTKCSRPQRHQRPRTTTTYTQITHGMRVIFGTFFDTSLFEHFQALHSKRTPLAAATCRSCSFITPHQYMRNMFKCEICHQRSIDPTLSFTGPAHVRSPHRIRRRRHSAPKSKQNVSREILGTFNKHIHST